MNENEPKPILMVMRGLTNNLIHTHVF